MCNDELLDLTMRLQSIADGDWQRSSNSWCLASESTKRDEFVIHVARSTARLAMQQPSDNMAILDKRETKDQTKDLEHSVSSQLVMRWQCGDEELAGERLANSSVDQGSSWLLFVDILGCVVKKRLQSNCKTNLWRRELRIESL